MDNRPEDYWVTIDDTLVGRKPGASAAARARELRRADPVGAITSRLLRRRTDERNWQKGANGEVVTGLFLNRLPSGWHVFHAVPIGHRGADIDHVVIGPGGVFTVNTKNLTGTIRVTPRSLTRNGHRTDFLPKAAAEAKRASRLLSAAVGWDVTVHGVLAIIADDLDIREEPTDVHVGSPRGVRRWLLEQPHVLTLQQAIQLAGAAHKPSTWTRDLRRSTASESAQAPRAGDPCGCAGELVERRRSDGRPFLGCSRFPRCRRTRPAAGPQAGD